MRKDEKGGTAKVMADVQLRASSQTPPLRGGRLAALLRPARLVVLVVTAALSLSCSDSDPTGPGSPQNSLVFTRADQSEISFSSDALLFVWCGPWEEGEVETPSLHVLFAGAAEEDPGWHLRAVVGDVTLGDPLLFPNSFNFDQPKEVNIFVVDPPNELSTQDDQSGGSITFQQLDCGNAGEVQFSIDAVIGSELGDGPSVNVTGTFRAPIGQAPS